MATTGEFIPELWSMELIDQMKKNLWHDFNRPKRSKAAQMLRDAALGRPEYPEFNPDLHRSYATNMTATELRMRNEMYQSQIDFLNNNVAPAILSILSSRSDNV